MPLWKKVFLGLVIGIIIGIIARFTNPVIVDYIKPIGDIFINLLKMIVVPILFFSIISGITSVRDTRTLGRIGIKAAFAFLSTTIIAVSVGLLMANLMKPGMSADFSHLIAKPASTHGAAASVTVSIIDIIMGFVPTNIFQSFATGNTLHIVFFAFFTGIVLNLMDAEGRKVIDGCNLMAKIIFRMVGIIIQLSPYGAGALIAWLVGKYGIDELLSLLNFTVCVSASMGIQYFLFGTFILICGRMSPLPFYRKSLEYQAVALSTISSKATLPTTMNVCREKMGMSHISTSFLLPLGASVNMVGISIYLGISAVFFAQAFNIDLTWHEYMVIIITSTIGTVGVAGIVGGSLMIMPMVLASVGIPIEGVALIAGIDRILEMIRTVVNITGDAAVTLIIDKSEGTLNTDVYNH